MFGMLWRFGLLIVILNVLSLLALAGLEALHVSVFIDFWIVAGIWLTPMYLAHRAQTKA